ncbi:hypothetical protein NDU88_004922 [Pleurodeles waltl]|uniref:Uncharacterized protein n=1 Tax=Pleurodeles waltl TaxID=8319 RepID=A0AAV7LL86_PLEWA|nr:hypothetical protein NDU88_004922 [Pleurodeles waltl]
MEDTAARGAASEEIVSAGSRNQQRMERRTRRASGTHRQDPKGRATSRSRIRQDNATAVTQVPGNWDGGGGIPEPQGQSSGTSFPSHLQRSAQFGACASWGRSTKLPCKPQAGSSGNAIGCWGNPDQAIFPLKRRCHSANSYGNPGQLSLHRAAWAPRDTWCGPLAFRKGRRVSTPEAPKRATHMQTHSHSWL